MIRNVLLIASLIIFVLGCASMPSMPGNIQTSTSEFDGATEIYMYPTWVCKYGTLAGCSFKFGLQKRSTMPEDQILLIVEVSETGALSEPSLLFNIDGEIVKFVSIDKLTDFSTHEGIYIPGTYSYGISSPGLHIPPTNWSSKRYLIDKAFMERILNAERVAVRINLGKSYVEGLFSQNKPTTARPAFRMFYKKVFEGSNQELK
jgi:hypothetical protein